MTEETTTPSVEDRAREMGWVPAEEWQGDPETHLEPGEFIRRKPLFDKIADQNKQLRDLRKTMDTVVRQVSGIKDSAYQKALNELTAKRDEAIRTGQPSAVQKVEAEIESVKKDKQAYAPPVDPELVEWHAKNKWFAENKRLAKVADALASDFLEEHPGSPTSELLEHVDNGMKKLYPAQFGQQEEPAKEKPPARRVADGDMKPAPRHKTYRDLPREYQKACDVFVKSGVLTVEEYIKALHEQGDI